MLLIDPNSGEIVNANRSAILFYGYDNLIGLNIKDINTFSKEQVEKEIKTAREESRNYFIFRHKLGNGEIRTVEVRSTPYLFEEKTLLLSTIEDISHQRVEHDDLWHYQELLEEAIEKNKEELIQSDKMEHRLYFAVISILLISSFVLVVLIRKLKKANRDIESEKLRLEGILEGTNVGTWEWNVQSGETIFNQRWAQIVGYTLEELEPISIETWTRLAHLEDLKKSEELLKMHFRGEIAYYEFESRIKHKCGEWVWVLDRGKVISWDELGNPLMMMGTHQDISDAKDLEEGLKESEEKYKSLVENIPGITYRCRYDNEWTMIFISKNIKDISGYESGELIGNHIIAFNELIYFEDQNLVKNSIQKAIDDNSRWEIEYRIKHRDESIRYVYESGRAIVDSSGEVEYLDGFILEISDKKRYQKELEETKRRLETTIKASKIGLWEFDMVKDSIYWNRSSFNMLGYEDGEFELDYQTWISLIHPDDREKIDRDLKSQIENRSSFIIEFRFKHKDGSWFWIDGRGEVVEYGVDGAPTKMSGIHIDKNLQKRQEEELLKQKEIAEVANMAKSQFLANMSHEIRTPLNAVIGFSEILSRTNLNEKQKNLTSKIESSSKILLGIISDILDSSKIEAGKLEFEIKELSFEELISKLRDLFAQSATKKGVELYFDIDKEIPKVVLGDELRISQVLANLLSNAIKFTQKGRVVFKLENLQKSNKSALIGFSIEDSGIGMSGDVLSSLFQPFVQADSSTTRKYGGTGLGLDISQKIVKALGGEIRATSKEGVGSKFYFELNFDVVSWDKIEIKTKEEHSYSLLGLRVLLVEDNEVNVEVLSMILKSDGARVDVANNGKEGVLKLSNGTYDVILMDIQMPIMSGYEATKAIRDSGNKIPIIALSANVMKEDIQRAYECGVDDYLTKPINRDELYKKIAKLCNLEIQTKNSIKSSNKDSSIASKVLDLDVLRGAISDKSMISRLYEMFLKDLNSKYSNIIELLREDSLDSAKSLVHSLKGSSGNVGAMELFFLSQKIDFRLKSDKKIDNEDIESLQKCIDSTKEALTREIRDGDAELKPNLTFKEAFSKLYDAISQSEPCEKGVLNSVIEGLKEQDVREDIESLRESVVAYDYEKALEILDRVKNLSQEKGVKAQE